MTKARLFLCILLPCMHVLSSEQTTFPRAIVPQTIAGIIAAYSFPLLLTTTKCADQEPRDFYYTTLYLGDDSNTIQVQRLRKEWIIKRGDVESSAVCQKETLYYKYNENTLTLMREISEQHPEETYNRLGSTFHIRNHTHAKEVRHRFGVSMVPMTPVESETNGAGNCVIYNEKLGLIATYASPGTVSLYADPSKSTLLIYNALKQ